MTSEASAAKWLGQLRPQVLRFVAALRGERAGFHRYSLSGDLRRREDWGLGNAVFAAKTYYMLDALEPSRAAQLAHFIQGFQRADGQISDPWIARANRRARVITALRQRSPRNLLNGQTRRAETRQAFAALRCLGHRPHHPFVTIPEAPGAISRFVRRLDWAKNPWGAASHVSHLVFFLRANAALFGRHAAVVDELVQSALDAANTYQRPDGSWYAGAAMPDVQRVNAAMKMMTAFDAAGGVRFARARELIDLCLGALNDSHACNNFNIVCVLYHCQRQVDHRRDEIRRYCLERLTIYRQFFWPEHGGFSFLRGQADPGYYGARVTAGRPEPDIHGTALFVWGCVLISELLGLRERLGLRPPFN